MWNALTDYFPFNENQARPSWYIYGWPVCFATSGRCRFNFYLCFDTVALIVDLGVTLVMMAATAFAVETLSRQIPRLRIVDVLGIVTGVALMVLILFNDGLHQPLRFWLGARPPRPDLSAVTGDVRLTSRLPISVRVPLAAGLTAVGLASVQFPIAMWARLRRCD